MTIFAVKEEALTDGKIFSLIEDYLRKDLIIRVDSNGSMPEVIKLISNYVDGFAIDIKAPPFNKEKYEFTIRTHFDVNSLIESIKIASELPYTIFRTIKYPWLTEDDVREIREFVKNYGKGKPYYVNPFFEIAKEST